VAKPIVDGLEKDLEGKADVIRLNAMTSIGRQAAAHFGARGLPTLVLVDGNGEVVLTQVGIIRSGPILDKVEHLITP
jgi:thiol-disulfide isomerase/thioredoxin